MTLLLEINGDAVPHETTESVLKHLTNVLSGYSLAELLSNPPTMRFIAQGPLPDPEPDDEHD